MYEELHSRFNQQNHSEVRKSGEDVLRKDLESELRLDRQDIRSYAWYHGKLPRDISEELVQNDGDFLIRESISNVGEHVLTMRWNGSILHFKINQYDGREGPYLSRPCYAFERESFDSIAALITHHVGQSIPISVHTGAVIRMPINRKLPLSYSDVKYASLRRSKKTIGGGDNFPASHAPGSILSNHPAAGFVLTRPPSVTDGGNVAATSPQPFPLQLPGADTNGRTARAHFNVETSPDNQLGSDILGPLPTVGRASPSDVPPKPSRVPSFRRPVIRHQSSKSSKKKGARESEKSAAESAFPSTSSPSVAGLLSSTNTSYSHANKSGLSMFRPSAYVSEILSEENKPVDDDAMKTIRSTLLETDPFKLARHVTLNDCEVCRVLDCGLQDIFLPKGKVFRSDLLERYQTFAFWVALCILRGSNSKQDRVDILNVFIQIANELVHSLGNVFGFSAIMHGLLCPQIRGLDDLWLSLRKRYINNAVTMEKKLIPLIQLMDEGKGQISTESTCIPHILPVLRYLENPLASIPHAPPAMDTFNKKQLSASEGNILGSVASDKNELSPWWQNLPNDSFDGLMAQLSLARVFLSSLMEFRGNALGKLKDFERKSIAHEMFGTEFHLRILWGFKGADYPQRERYEKCDQLITLMSKRPQ